MMSGYTYPAPHRLAPGQLVTLFVQGMERPIQSARVPTGADLPTTLSGFSVVIGQLLPGVGLPIFQIPIQEVRTYINCTPSNTPTCFTPVGAVTIQVPFELEFFSASTTVRIAKDGQFYYLNSAYTAFDQIRLLRVFDSVLPITVSRVSEPGELVPCGKSWRNDNLAPENSSGMPCQPMVKHSDGSLVSPAHPAKAGEELVALAVGLGRTSPAAETGKVVLVSSPTETNFLMDFNYKPNALGSRPLETPEAPAPLYAGTLEGSVGIYQVKFVVPPVPPGTPPCSLTWDTPLHQRVYSNLTVSIGGQFSFDGAGICVAVDSTDPGNTQEKLK